MVWLLAARVADAGLLLLFKSEDVVEESDEEQTDEVAESSETSAQSESCS
jgi:hypothetical protein